MHERPGDLDAAHLAAGEIADSLAHPIGEADPRDELAGAATRLCAADALQRALVEHVLLDGEIGIEGAALKDHAELGERRAAVARDVMAEDSDRARAAARPVEPEQHDEGRRRDCEADVVERLARAIGVRHALDREGGRKDRGRGGGSPVVHVLAIAAPGRCLRRRLAP